MFETDDYSLHICLGFILILAGLVALVPGLLAMLRILERRKIRRAKGSVR
jgi:hypothetical protein